MSNVIEQVSLFCKSGSKDAVYHMQIVEVVGGYMVNYQNGRAGGTLTHGVKTAKGPVTIEAARKLFEKVAREKMTASPPYQRSEGSGSQFTAVAQTMQALSTGLEPQLLNDVGAGVELEQLINDPNWIAQQKYDGERRMVKRGAPGDRVVGSNRKALEVPLPAEVAGSLGAVVATVDSEIIGSRIYAFDLLEMDGVDLRHLSYLERKQGLDAIAEHFGPAIRVAESAWTPEQKRALIERTRLLGQEGVVFKRASAPYTPGRPASGGDQLRLKHWETATVIVLGAKEDRRSVRIGVTDSSSGVEIMVEVGAVTIPPNQETPSAGELIDVRYLYAYPQGSLFEPTFKRVRTDVDRTAAHRAQLKLKVAHIDATEQGMQAA